MKLLLFLAILILQYYFGGVHFSLRGFLEHSKNLKSNKLKEIESGAADMGSMGKFASENDIRHISLMHLSNS